MLKQNLVTQYHQPPFKPQEQKWPGLASKMVPRPDHGETTYKGSGRLAGRKALITGGDSGIGRAAAIAFARERADVAFGYLPEEQEDADELVDLIKAAGQKACRHIRNEAFCRKLVDEAATPLGGLDILVSNAARLTRVHGPQKGPPRPPLLRRGGLSDCLQEEPMAGDEIERRRLQMLIEQYLETRKRRHDFVSIANAELAIKAVMPHCPVSSAALAEMIAAGAVTYGLGVLFDARKTEGELPVV
ncbi:SDR family NAD(P)-dependent oxidoreductase [Mesorhizobium sp. M0847]|uniref:SDR family NAD(P)-dependent oxidoreductase n=2 Tax=unclassified Mesorhizobium TaxID=325217 RepID=UPI00333563E1